MAETVIPCESSMLQDDACPVVLARAAVGDGVGVFAKRRVDAGTTLVSTRPYVWVATTGLACDACCRSLEETGAAAKLLRCSGCKRATYCNRACQRAAWKAFHSAECKRRAKLPADALLKPALALAVRLVYLMENAGMSQAQLADVDAFDAPKVPLKGDIAGDVARVLALLPTGARIRSPAVHALLIRLHFSATTVWNAMGNPVGLAFVPLHCRFNHSCDASAVVHFEDGPVCVVRTLRAVPADEEITIAYCDQSMPRDARQQSLVAWGFLCACARCASGAYSARADVDVEALLSDCGQTPAEDAAADAAAVLERVAAAETSEDVCRVLTGDLARLEARVGPHYTGLLQARAAVIRALMDLSLEGCEELAERILETSRAVVATEALVLPPHHPSHALDALIHAKLLAAFLASTPDERTVAECRAGVLGAQRSFEIAHGKDATTSNMALLTRMDIFGN